MGNSIVSKLKSNLKQKLSYLVQSSNILKNALYLAERNLLLRFLYKAGIQRLIDFHYPLRFDIELTNACNLKCRMCPRHISSRRVGYIDMNLFEALINESSNYGKRRFQLHKDGEPLMHPRFLETIRYIKEKKQDNIIDLVTNGTLLNHDISKAILEIGVDTVTVSIGASRESTYQKVRGVYKLEKVEQNVINLLKMKKEGGYKKPSVSVQIIRMEETLEDIEDFRKRWTAHGASVDVSGFLNWGGSMRDITVKNTVNGRRHPCPQLWFSPVVNWNGDVSICCLDWNASEIIGNVNAEPLTKIWSNEKIKQYRLYHLRGEYSKISPCKDCNAWIGFPDMFFFWQKGPRINKAR